MSRQRRRGNPPEPPRHLLCPINEELFVDPVTALDGFTYSRFNVEEVQRFLVFHVHELVES